LSQVRGTMRYGVNMPGKSTKTKPAAVRLAPLGHHMLDELAEHLHCTRSEAHKRALVAGTQQLMGPMPFAAARARFEGPGVNK
jgi:hypothetical protein